MFFYFIFLSGLSSCFYLLLLQIRQKKFVLSRWFFGLSIKQTTHRKKKKRKISTSHTIRESSKFFDDPIVADLWKDAKVMSYD